MREIISRKDAIAKGMNRYFTGKECKNNHIDERSVIDWACVSCRNEIRQKTHIKNIEKDKARDAKYYQENKERLDEINKQWRKDNPDACKKHSRQSFLNNPARVDLHTKARRAHTKINLSKDEKKRMHKIINTVREINKLAGEVVVHRDHILPLNPVHHITKKPLPIKGMDHPDNCQILSATENMEKGNKFRPEDQLLFLERMNFLKPLTNKNFYEESSIKKKNV